jgi:hypothetical protein
MINEIISSSVPQPPLFELEEGIEQVELFPEVWSAAERMISQDLQVRWDGFEQLLELNAQKYSPLITYLMCTRIGDPDIDLRSRIVEVLAEVIRPDQNSKPALENVRTILLDYFSGIRTRQIYNLLQVVVAYPNLIDTVSRLINACSYANTQLVEIINDRTKPLEIRQEAIRIIGAVGYVEAIPSLDRLSARLEARMNGQKAMPFAPPSEKTEMDLLVTVREALVSLRAP